MNRTTESVAGNYAAELVIDAVHQAVSVAAMKAVEQMEIAEQIREKKQAECEHEEFEAEGDWRKNIQFGGLGETLEIPAICKACGLKAREVYLYSCRLSDDDKHV